MQYLKNRNLIAVSRGLLEIDTLSRSTKSDLEQLQLSLVIPTYNERKNLEQLISNLVAILDQNIPQKYELIIVDDNSIDRTCELALNLAARYSQIRVMSRQQEKGLATAIIRGWQSAKSEILAVIDADLQHPPEILVELWQEMEKGADIAIASRHVAGGGVSQWNVVRRFLSRGAQMLGLLILPEVLGRISDPMSGYFMVRRDAIAGKTLKPLGYKILIEIMARGNIRWIAEVGYVFRERKTGESKVTYRQYWAYIRHLIRLRWDLWQIERLVRFAISGMSGVLVNMTILYLLREYLGLGLTRSAIIAGELAIINNFYWNDRWTFRDISAKQKGKGKKFKRLLKFNLICFSGLMLNVLIINLLYNLFYFNEYLANIMAIALVTFWNFWFNLKLNWRTSDR